MLSMNLVDDAALERLRDDLTRSSGTPGLYHAVRTPLRNPYAKRCPHADAPWGEFLSGVEVVEVCSHQTTTGRWQQSCYFGDREKLHYFTGLAAQAIAQMPIGLLPFHTSDRIPAVDRDHFMLSIYGIGLHAEYELPLDFLGNGSYAKFQLDREVLDILACLIPDREREQERLRALASALRQGGRGGPRFIYGSLAMDVFSSASAALNLLMSRREEICGRDQGTLLDFDELAKLFKGKAPKSPEAHQTDSGTFTETEQLVLRILREAGRRLTRTQIQAAAGEITAKSTMKLVLSGLVRRGILDNRQDVDPKGYGLPERRGG